MKHIQSPTLLDMLSLEIFCNIHKAGCFSAKPDVSAAKRFFKKLMRAAHRRLPFSIIVDKSAAYPEAFSASQVEKLVPSGLQAEACEIPEQCN